MDISSLKAFLAVSKFQSYTKAAKQLFITQSAVSKRIAKLEAEVGARLFNQIGHCARLTEAGQRLLPFASEIVIFSHDAINSINELDNSIGGTVVLGVTYFAGIYRLPQILKKFLAKYPDVNFDIRYLSAPEIYTAIEKADLDFAISMLAPPVSPYVHTKYLWQEELRVFVKKAHPLTEYKSPTINVLSNYPAILPEPGFPIRDSVESLFLKANKHLTVKMDMNNLNVIKEMVSIGLGWGVLPVDFLTPDLEIIDVTSLTINHKYYLVHHKKKKFSTTEKQVIEFFSLSEIELNE